MATRSAARTPPATAGAAAKAQAAPLVLTGPPTSLRGRITVANASPERLVIRGGLLHVAGREPISVPLTVLLRPRTTAEVAFGVDLGEAWPPGTFEGELEVGGQRHPAIVRVEQVADAMVSPGSLLAAVGSTPVTLVVRNVGNAALPLAVRTRGRLVPQDASNKPPDPARDVSAGRSAPRSTGAPHAELTLSGAVRVEPGAEMTVEAVVTVPDRIDGTHRYHAVLPVGPADLVVTVLPADPASEAAPRKAAPRKAAPRKAAPRKASAEKTSPAKTTRSTTR